MSTQTKQVKDLSASDLGKVVTLRDVEFQVSMHDSRYGEVTKKHSLMAVTDVLQEIVVRGKFEGGLFRRPKSITLKVGTLTAVVDAQSFVEVSGEIQKATA